MKKFLLLTAACIASFCSYSQSFMHGVGMVVMVDKMPFRDATSSFGFTYSPRLNFLENGNTSLSVGLPLSAALGGSYNVHYGSYYEEEGNIRYSFNAPVIVNFNYGKGATRNANKRLGFFVGGGYAYYYSGQTEFYSDDESAEFSYHRGSGTTGPVGNAGMRIGVGRRTHNIEIKFSYMKGLGDFRPDVYTFATLFNF